MRFGVGAVYKYIYISYVDLVRMDGPLVNLNVKYHVLVHFVALLLLNLNKKKKNFLVKYLSKKLFSKKRSEIIRKMSNKWPIIIIFQHFVSNEEDSARIAVVAQYIAYTKICRVQTSNGSFRFVLDLTLHRKIQKFS